MFIMSIKLTNLFHVLWLSSVFIIAGCASDPVAPTAPEPVISGETMLRESQGIAHLSERWKSGKQLVDNGRQRVREGEAKIAEGNRMIEEGNKIIRESEESYKNIKY